MKITMYYQNKSSSTHMSCLWCVPRSEQECAPRPSSGIKFPGYQSGSETCYVGICFLSISREPFKDVPTGFSLLPFELSMLLLCKGPFGGEFEPFYTVRPEWGTFISQPTARAQKHRQHRKTTAAPLCEQPALMWKSERWSGFCLCNGAAPCSTKWSC